MVATRARLTISTLTALLVVTLATGCASPSTPTSTPTSIPAATVAPTKTFTPVPPTATSTAAKTPTSTPAPTETAVPTKTPTLAAPTKAPTSLPTQPAPTATSTSTGGGDEFTPKVTSVWETAIGQDIMAGVCTGGPILPAYGLVQITPNSDALTWLSQEPAPYTFFRTAPNTFYYSGPTSTGDGAVTMTLRFTSTTTLAMQRIFTPASDPACTHTHNYTGTFQWNVP